MYRYVMLELAAKALLLYKSNADHNGVVMPEHSQPMRNEHRARAML